MFTTEINEMKDFLQECFTPAIMFPAIGMAISGFGLYVGLWLIF